jgi:hypothetical protein
MAEDLDPGRSGRAVATVDLILGAMTEREH